MDAVWIELNLRKGGTTHPFLTLQFLCGGNYDGERGVFVTPEGATKYLAATDHLEDDRLKVLTVEDLFDVVVQHGVHFDQSRRTGVVFHMISCLTECGRRIGMTAVGDSPEEAWRGCGSRSRCFCVRRIWRFRRKRSSTSALGEHVSAVKRHQLMTACNRQPAPRELWPMLLLG